MPKRKLTRRGSKRRAQLLEAATRLFGEQGYTRTTVGDICDTLGVGKGVFYWYFRSKEALFSELLQGALLELRRAQHTAIDKVEDPVARIEDGIRASISFFRHNPGILEVMRTAARYEQFATLVENGQQIVVADTATHVKEAMGRGSIRDGDAEFMAHGIIGAIFHFVETYFATGAEAMNDRPQLEDEAVDFCLRGLLVR
ncbi:MAG: TetR/AcrR family transcriptional regulator [Actinomycetota bacterium]